MSIVGKASSAPEWRGGGKFPTPTKGIFSPGTEHMDLSRERARLRHGLGVEHVFVTPSRTSAARSLSSE